MLAWSLPQAEQREVRNLFLSLDTLHNGRIQLDHLQSTSAASACTLGHLQYSEFLAAFVSAKDFRLQDAVLKEAFRRFCVYSEVESVFVEPGIDVTDGTAHPKSYEEFLDVLWPIKEPSLKSAATGATPARTSTKDELIGMPGVEHVSRKRLRCKCSVDCSSNYGPRPISRRIRPRLGC